jgi:hypothetical protein
VPDSIGPVRERSSDHRDDWITYCCRFQADGTCCDCAPSAADLVAEVERLRARNAQLEIRLRERDDECNRWALRWATDDRQRS